VKAFVVFGDHIVVAHGAVDRSQIGSVAIGVGTSQVLVAVNTGESPVDRILEYGSINIQASHIRIFGEPLVPVTFQAGFGLLCLQNRPRQQK
jgi:hypothetical protein